MTLRRFLVFAMIAFLIASTGSDVFARVTIGRETLSGAFSQHSYYAGKQLIGTVMLFAPFAILAVVASRLHDRTNRTKALIIWSIPTAYLAYSYFSAYQASQMAMLDERWTAATLSIGLLPFEAVPVLLVTWSASRMIAKRSRTTGDADSRD